MFKWSIYIYAVLRLEKQYLYRLWRGFSKFRQSFNFATPIIDFINSTFFKKSVSSKRSTQMTFPFSGTVVILIPIPLNTLSANSSSASDFNIIQHFLEKIAFLGKNNAFTQSNCVKAMLEIF